MSEVRVLRLPLPVDLIREMDELVAARVGGLDSRAELAREAIEAMVLELRHGVYETQTCEGSDGESRDVADRNVPAESPPLDPRAATEGDAAFTSLAGLPVVTHLVQPVESADDPLLGMHNRDYPSLWAGIELCNVLKDGPVQFEAAATAVTETAHRFGTRLLSLDGLWPGKPSALFPTNPNKMEAARRNFEYFAIGWITRDPDGSVRLHGPLADWKVLGLKSGSREPLVGLTEPGRDLLTAMSGLTVTQPHPPEYARAFLAHLASYAPGDWQGLVTMLHAVSGRPTRIELNQAFADHWPGWTSTIAATAGAGYVARGREWGLVQTGQVERRYALTDFGDELLASATVQQRAER